MKKETLNITNCIEIDKEKAKNFLNKKGNYRQPGVFIENWKVENNKDNYAAYFEKNKFSYFGILDSKLKRHKYGINTLENGDKYIGNFENDKREGTGIYIHSPVESRGYKNLELYLGNWKENSKNLNGIYIWLKEKNDSFGYDSADIDVFSGIVDQDAIKRGCYLSKINNKFYAYFGKFEENGTKCDDKAYFYDFSNDKVICGKIRENKFQNGYLLVNSTNSNSTKIFHVEFDEKDNISSYISEDKLEKSIRDEYTNSMSEFREILLKKDYFKDVYNKFYEIKNFAEKNLSDISILNDDIEYQAMIDVSTTPDDMDLFKILDNSINLN